MSGRSNPAVLLALLLYAAPAGAQEALLPVPRAIIYPGDTLTDASIEESAISADSIGASPIRAREALIGKVARRTLLPGRPIPAGAVEQPRLVSVGAQVKLVYMEDGLRIAAFGVAQQAGGAGDLIRVRNLDSGLFVNGRIQGDGSVRVGEG